MDYDVGVSSDKDRIDAAPRNDAGPKSRSAAVSRRTTLCYRLGRQSAAPHLDSEQFRSAPRTCWPLGGRL